MLKIRQSHNRLILNMGIPIPEKVSLYIEMGAQMGYHKSRKEMDMNTKWSNNIMLR